MPKQFFNEKTGTFDFSASDLSLDVFNKMNNKYELLTSRNYHNNYNPLMVAIYKRRDAVPVLLKALESLDSTQIINILNSLDSCNGQLIIIPWEENYPHIVPYFIETIASLNALSIEEKYSQIIKLINNVSKSYSNQLKKENQNVIRIILDMKIATWEKDIKQLLENLKPAQSDNTNYIINSNSPQSLLYRDLDSALSLYLNSHRTKEDLKLFHDEWNYKINEARTSGQFNNQVQIGDVLTSIALILSIIGIIYLAYQAGKNQARNRSLFFPGVFEKKLNKLQDETLKMTNYKTDENNDQQKIQDNPIPSAPVLRDASQNNPPPYMCGS